MIWRLLFIIIFGCIWGKAVNEIVQNKGYTENWFWWGFFFGLIALIVAILMPEKPVFVKEENYFGSDESVVANNDFGDSKKMIAASEVSKGWKCPLCGEMNAGYAGSCSCGYNSSGNI